MQDVCHQPDAGACDPVVSAVKDADNATGYGKHAKHYGDHCKTAYVIYEQLCNGGLKAADMKGRGLQELIDKATKADATAATTAATTAALGSWPGLEGYTCVANIKGYPGRAGVFTKPAKVTHEGLYRLAAAETPSFLGYIAEGTGPDGMPELVIAFRGTQTLVNKADWETNLLGAVATRGLYADCNGMVHRGFFNLVNGTPDDADEDTNPMKIIKAAIARYEKDHNKLPRIITTGHSLGGALAVVAAVGIAHSMPEYRDTSSEGYTSRKLQTYTFAAPRIGDDKLAQYLRGTLMYTAVQVKNKTDATPYLPPAGPRHAYTALKKLIGMVSLRPRKSGGLAPASACDTALDQDMSFDMETWEAYQDVLEAFQASRFGLDSTASDEEQVKKFKLYMDNLRQQRESAASGVGMSTATTDNALQKMVYGMKLLGTVTTNWSDTPAPRNGICTLNVRKSGKWGGQNHSLQVYLDHLKTGAQSEAQQHCCW